MKTIEEVREYGRHLKLPELGINTLVAAWSSPPARRVKSTWRSAVARFASWKMARTIQAESLWVEFLFVFLAEFATEVLGYLDQPFKLKLPHAEKTGKWGAHWYTPDFIVLYPKHVEVVECKTEEELVELSQKKPWLYLKTCEGRWSCPPGEKAVEQYGFRFRVWTPPTNCALVVRNIRMLQDYLRDDCPIVSEDVKAKLLDVITQRPGVTLSEILLESDGWRMDHVYILIARGEVYFDLRNQILAEPDRAQLFIDEPTAVAFDSIRKDLTGAPINLLSEVRLMIGASLVWKTRAYKIANFTEDQVVLTATEGSIELPRLEFETMARRGEIAGLSESSDLEALARARELVMESSQQELSEAVRKQ